MLSRPGSARGKNGWVIAKGLELMLCSAEKTIRICPITTRNTDGKSALEIPIEDVPAVLTALAAAVNMEIIIKPKYAGLPVVDY